MMATCGRPNSCEGRKKHDVVFENKIEALVMLPF